MPESNYEVRGRKGGESVFVRVVRVDGPDLALLVAVALGTVSRRRKRRQTMMTVGEDSLPLEVVEAIAKKYERGMK